VTNTYNPPPGKVTVHKVVKWNGHGPWGQSFEICLDKLVGSTPTPVGCQAVGYAGGTVEWNNLPPGTYRVQETAPPAPWKVEQQTAPFVLPAGGQHESTITNSYDRGRVKVTKVANWNGPVNPEQQFVICLAPASNPSEQYCRSVGAEGGAATWGDVPPGVYNVIEGPLGPGWEVVLPQPINVVPGDDYITATVTNTRLTGSLTVTKSVVWAGQAPPAPASFQVCIAGPSYPSGDCKTATFTAFSSSPAAQPLTWTDLQVGSYTVTETSPGSAWIVAVEGSPATVSASAPGSAYVTNTYNVGRITAVKTVNWNDYTPSPVQFEICLDSISGESPTRIGCQSVGQAGGSVEWNNLPAGTYRVVETTPPAPWTAQQVNNGR
jgi:hypothetical protein